MNKIKKILIWFEGLGLGLLFFSLATAAQAASMYFSPASGARKVGDTFAVAIYVGSPDQPMNAALGVVSFPEDKLQITGISKSGSVVGLWVQEPSFSNSKGTVNFEGVVLNPGFTGSSGKIITLNFKVKAAGTSSLTFSSGSVLANDGMGSNILAGLGSANFTLAEASKTTPPASTPPPSTTTPKTPATPAKAVAPVLVTPAATTTAATPETDVLPAPAGASLGYNIYLIIVIIILGLIIAYLLRSNILLKRQTKLKSKNR